MYDKLKLYNNHFKTFKVAFIKILFLNILHFIHFVLFLVKKIVIFFRITKKKRYSLTLSLILTSKILHSEITTNSYFF